jgi:hypothetical protein
MKYILTLIISLAVIYFLVYRIKYEVFRYHLYQKLSDPVLNQLDPSLKDYTKYLEKFQSEVKVIPERRKEIYHIRTPYSYNDAKKVCEKYGGRLATYHELNQFQNGKVPKSEFSNEWTDLPKGNKYPNWCSYGWSDEQVVAYPIQEEFLKDLPESEQRKCGRPGVNWFYEKDTSKQFGVNCFGIKPSGDSIYNQYENKKPPRYGKGKFTIKVDLFDKPQGKNDGYYNSKQNLIYPFYDNPYRNNSVYTVNQQLSSNNPKQ